MLGWAKFVLKKNDHGEVDFEIMLERAERSKLRVHRPPETENVKYESYKEICCR